MPQVFNMFDAALAATAGPSAQDLSKQDTTGYTTEDFAKLGLIDPETGGLTTDGLNLLNKKPSGMGDAAKIAGGLGSLVSSAGNLYFDIAQRAIQKKQFAEGLAQLATQYHAQQIQQLTSLGQIEGQGQRAQAKLAGEIAGRGMGKSSIAQQQPAQVQYNIDVATDKQLREMALATSNYNTQVALMKLAQESANLAFQQKMFGEGVGAAVGVASLLLLLSDKNQKTDFKNIDTKMVLEKVNEVPVTSWNYKSDPVNRHLGPMAQDWAKIVGGDGKTIDIVTANGILIACVQELTRRLEILENRIQ